MATEGGQVKAAKEKEDGLSIRKILYIVFGVTMVLDLPVTITVIVIGEMHRESCTVIAPLFLLVEGCIALAMYAAILLEIILYRLKDKRGFGWILVNVLQMLRIGCYLGASFTMWVFWQSCSRVIFYCSAIVAPIFCCIAMLQVVLISKL